jgi:hypothetical protein
MEGEHLGRAKVPLIHFSTVEWHMVDRVMQQFDLNQPIPDPFANRPQWGRLHKLRWDKKKSVPWVTRHAEFIEIWNNAEEQLVQAPEVHFPRDEYLQWYSKMTVTLLQVPPQGEPAIGQNHLQFEPHGNREMLIVSVYFN